MAAEPKPLAIVPAPSEEQQARVGYEELWRELISTKAKLADALNQIAAQTREVQDLRNTFRRHVRRLDALVSRVEAVRR